MPVVRKRVRSKRSTCTSSYAMKSFSCTPWAKKNPAKEFRVKCLTKNATMPKKGSDNAAGHDIACAEGGEVPANGKAIVSTDLAIAVPKGTYGRIAPRSGLAAKHHIQVGAGVIDQDYRGCVKVVLFNHGTTPFRFEKGDRIAQLILEKIDQTKAIKVQTLDETTQGNHGFGSTGSRVKLHKSQTSPESRPTIKNNSIIGE